MQSTLFVSQASSEDDLERYALHLLNAAGCNTLLLAPGELAPPTAVALFKAPTWLRWPNGHLRAAAHIVKPFAPAWAAATPFVVAMRSNAHGDFANALVSMARNYEHWFVLGGRGLPWGQAPRERIDEVRAWKSAVADLLATMDEPWERTPALWVTPEKKHRERNRRIPEGLLLERTASFRLDFASAF